MSRQSKAIQQKQYRDKEGECINTLRDVINELTGQELQTRHEILTKGLYLICCFKGGVANRCAYTQSHWPALDCS